MGILSVDVNVLSNDMSMENVTILEKWKVLLEKG